MKRTIRKTERTVISGLFVLGLGATVAQAQPDYGPAHWNPAYSGHWYTSGNGHKFCVIHDMEGYYQSTISYFQRSTTQVSIHYCANGQTDYSGDAAPGDITQMVREAYYAWHVGCWNLWMFGTEHEGFVSNPAWFTEPMYQASALLQRHLCDTYGIPKDRNHIIGHNEHLNQGWKNWMAANYPSINTGCNSHTDPGANWDWSHFMQLVLGGTDNASFVSQTVLNGSTFAPGQAFSCTFVMHNSGTLTWTANGSSGYTFNNNGGNSLGGAHATAPPANIAPNANGSFTINFTAPGSPGSYSGTFQMNNANNAYFGQQISFTINVANPAPTITTQPQGETKNPGETATFSVAATGATAYQWQRNGVNISAATGATLTLPSVQLSNAGFYTVVVSNAGGSVTSDSVQLVVTSTATETGTGTGLRGMYYENVDFTALKVSRVDGTVNFNWGLGSPDSLIGADTFSARWTGQVEPLYSQTYTFYTATDDGVRLWVNGVLLIDKWIDQGGTEWSGGIVLTAGQKYDIRMDYYENGGGAGATLSWSSASAAKSIIPQSQLYRPAPTFPAVVNQTVNPGNLLSLTVSANDWDQVAAVQPFEDFETFADGSASDVAMFRKPGNSSTTSAFLDGSVTNYDATTASFPAGNASTRALKASWSFATGMVNPWLRLNTFNSALDPNPTVDFNKALWFDMYTDKALGVGLGLRETSSSAAIGANGGTAGPIEFVGVPSKNGATPNPSRTVAAGAWTTLKFNIPREPLVGFTGNAVLESTTGLGVLEELALVPVGGMGPYNVYLDNFTVVQMNSVAYSLDPGAPTGASIDPTTGMFSWTPTSEQGGVSIITVRATDNGLPSQSSTRTFAVTVNTAPVITAQPQSQTVFPGADVTFTVSANGTAPLGYQWQFGGTDIPGATASAYTRNGVQSSDAGDYAVLVFNAIGSNLSSNATLTISISNSPPSITSQPQSQTVNQGVNATFSITVIGSIPLTYQWRFDGSDIAGATTSSCTRVHAQGMDAGTYSVIVTNEFGSAVSSNATLVVNLPPTIATSPQSQTVNVGSDVTFTVAATGTAPLSYQWKRNGTNISGATTTSYTRANVQASDAGTYSIVVGNVAGSVTNTAALNINVPPAITAHPQSQTVNPGAIVTFSVTATGTAPLTYQWKINGAIITGATGSSYTRNNVQSADVGNYSVVVSNLVGTVTSAEAALSINAVLVFSDDFESGTLNNWAVAVSPSTALSISTAQNHTGGGSKSADVNNTLNKMYHNLGMEVEGRVRATFWIFDPTDAGNNGGQNRAYGEVRSYVGAGYNNGGLQQLFAIGRYGVGFGTGTGGLATEVVNTTNYQGRVVSGANTGWFNLNAPGAPTRTTGWHRFEIERLADGVTINFYVDGILGRQITGASFATWDTATIGSIASGSTTADAWMDDIKVEYFDRPTITTQPISQTIITGTTATFNVAATGNVQGYQWRFNGANIPGATSATLTLNSAQPANAGSYNVVVQNGAGPATSANATLTVNVPPSITTQPASLTNNAGTTAIFTITAAGQAPLAYQWKKGASLLADGGNVSGATTAELTLVNVSQADAAAYSVIVSNSISFITSATATLTIIDPPVITTQPANQSMAAGASVTFNVIVGGTAPFAYQWKFDGIDIGGATSSSYTRTNVQSPDVGNFSVAVSNGAGLVVSSNASLTINHAPVLAAPGNRTIHAGATLTITNSVTDVDIPAQLLTFNLDPGAPAGLSINSTNGILTWTSTDADVGSTNTIIVRVADNGTPGLSDSRSFTVTTLAKPSIQNTVIASGTITITWSAIPGQIYHVQFKDELDDSDWIDLLDVEATEATASVLDSTTGDQSNPILHRFYRISLAD